MSRGNFVRGEIEKFRRWLWQTLRVVSGAPDASGRRGSRLGGGRAISPCDA
jgi:hypothetical protein